MICCPLPKWTPLSSIDHSPLLFHFFAALVVFHLVTSPLICIALLMVSVAVDGTINQQPHLAIITKETNLEHASCPWKPQMSSLETIHTYSDMHNGCPLAQVYIFWVGGRVFLSLSPSFTLSQTHTHRQRERVMGYKSNNGIPSLMWGAGPVRRPVSHENVSSDLEGLEQVYDIISVLPQQRYCSESPDGLVFPQGLTLCKQSQSAEIGRISKCFILSQTEWDTSDRAAA